MDYQDATLDDKAPSAVVDGTAIVTDALEALGRTSQEVFGFLLSFGAKGDHASDCSCPVANYLHTISDRHDGLNIVSVGSETVLAYYRSAGFHVLIPRPVNAFITAFDAWYPPFESLAA